jgi:hypothetical protein
LLREFYPAALAAFDEIGGRDSVAVLVVEPTPALGRTLLKPKIARFARNDRLGDAINWWAFNAMQTSPGLQGLLRAPPRLGPPPPTSR